MQASARSPLSAVVAGVCRPPLAWVRHERGCVQAAGQFDQLLLSDVHLGSDLVTHARPWAATSWLQSEAAVDDQLVSLLTYQSHHGADGAPQRRHRLVRLVGAWVAHVRGDGRRRRHQRLRNAPFAAREGVPTERLSELELLYVRAPGLAQPLVRPAQPPSAVRAPHGCRATRPSVPRIMAAAC
ncbi:MAG: hypothetical protein JWN48_443 [Myxococcaceae bacterium]|nr:hypothetical protein [Myxococcaceae bacterium]